MDSAGAPTAVVTPPGDIATSPGGGGAGVACSMVVPGGDDVGGSGTGGVFSGPLSEEQPLTDITVTATAPTANWGYLRMPSIYATLVGVNDVAWWMECCRL